MPKSRFFTFTVGLSVKGTPLQGVSVLFTHSLVGSFGIFGVFNPSTAVTGSSGTAITTYQALKVGTHILYAKDTAGNVLGSPSTAIVLGPSPSFSSAVNRGSIWRAGTYNTLAVLSTDSDGDAMYTQYSISPLFATLASLSTGTANYGLVGTALATTTLAASHLASTAVFLATATFVATHAVQAWSRNIGGEYSAFYIDGSSVGALVPGTDDYWYIRKSPVSSTISFGTEQPVLNGTGTFQEAIFRIKNPSDSAIGLLMVDEDSFAVRRLEGSRMKVFNFYGSPPYAVGAYSSFGFLFPSTFAMADPNYEIIRLDGGTGLGTMTSAFGSFAASGNTIFGSGGSNLYAYARILYTGGTKNLLLSADPSVPHLLTWGVAATYTGSAYNVSSRARMIWNGSAMGVPLGSKFEYLQVGSSTGFPWMPPSGAAVGGLSYGGTLHYAYNDPYIMVASDYSI